RALTYVALDVVIWGATELITTPVEMIATGNKMMFKVFYKEKRVVRVEELKIPKTQ
ncbi:MAG: hypothetical protein HY265_00170, partial [Deltaproteobacteria bacterium]|nr:hypothetical protein [Deltaproteobacteria bacterium]